MPPALARAHAALDRAVDRCYRPQPFATELARLEFLFGLYQQLSAPVLGAAPKVKPSLALSKALRSRAATVLLPPPILLVSAPNPSGPTGPLLFVYARAHRGPAPKPTTEPPNTKEPLRQQSKRLFSRIASCGRV